MEGESSQPSKPDRVIVLRIGSKTWRFERYERLELWWRTSPDEDEEEVYLSDHGVGMELVHAVPKGGQATITIRRRAKL